MFVCVCVCVFMYTMLNLMHINIHTYIRTYNCSQPWCVVHIHTCVTTHTTMVTSQAGEFAQYRTTYTLHSKVCIRYTQAYTNTHTYAHNTQQARDASTGTV